MVKLVLTATAGLFLSTSAAAQQNDIAYPANSLGTNAILSGDYATAEKQIRESRVSKYDPARALNLGLVFAKTGRIDKAEKQFEQVLLEDNVDLVLANGKAMSSHEAARSALAKLAFQQ